MANPAKETPGKKKAEIENCPTKIVSKYSNTALTKKGNRPKLIIFIGIPMIFRIGVTTIESMVRKIPQITTP